MAASIPDFGSRARFKSKVRTMFARLSSLSGVAFLWQCLAARRGVRILAYHGVESPPSSPFAVSVENFEKQAAYLAENFTVIDLSTLLVWQRGGHVSDKPLVVLTFDDGFKNNLEFAAPILKRFGLPATFFVIGGKLNDEDERFLTLDQVRQLQSGEGLSIGSHTFNHRSVGQIDADGLQEEIGVSKSYLEENLHHPIECFCYPYGTFNDFNDQSVEVLKQHRYLLACTSVNGINLRRTDPFRLRRTKVEWSDDMVTFKRLMNGAMDGWFFIDFFLRFLQKPRAVNFAQEAAETQSD